MLAAADALKPPPPVDLEAWAEENMVYGPNDPFPGEYRADRFPMLSRIFTVLGPDDPAREVTVRGSAQWGKTNLVNIVIGALFDRAPRDTLIVFPTNGAASEWVRSKFTRLRSRIAAVKRVFGSGKSRDSGDSMSRIETIDGSANLRIAAAGSPSELSGTTRPVVLMDDVAKFESGPMGDPEVMAASRAQAFDDAKIGRFSTPLIAGDCRITKAYLRGTQEQWHVPCPHCEATAPLRWENFEPNLIAGDSASAVFTCKSCGCLIEEKHRADIVARGAWVAANPGGDHPSFHIWGVYFGFRDWRSIADAWFRAKGNAIAEMSFFNDVLGLPYSAVSDAPDWEATRDRVENVPDEDKMPKGTIPAGHPILCAGVDCQGTWLEWTLVAFGPDGKRHTVDHGREDAPITEVEGKAALDRLLNRVWKNQHGRDVQIDQLTIDGGAYTAEVWDWAKRWPQSRVKIIKGGSSSTAPLYQLQKLERRADGVVKRRQKRAYILNVSAFKSALYADLLKTDPQERGFWSFSSGLGDAFFKGLASEHRVASRNAVGVVRYGWELLTPGLRNEPLDCSVYADFAARICHWRKMTVEEWDALIALRDCTPPDHQPGLFDDASPMPASSSPSPQKSAPAPRRRGQSKSSYV